MKLNKIFSCIDRLVEITIILLFFVMVVIGGLQVFNRFVLGTPLSWSEEVQKYSHIWMIFLAIPVCYRRGRHIGMEILTQKMPKVIQSFLAVFVDVMWLTLGLAVALFTARIMQVASMQHSPALEVRMDLVYLGEFLGGCYLVLVAGRALFARFKGEAAAP